MNRGWVSLIQQPPGEATLQVCQSPSRERILRICTLAAGGSNERKATTTTRDPSTKKKNLRRIILGSASSQSMIDLKLAGHEALLTRPFS
jgi:hypothetical protein